MTALMRMATEVGSEAKMSQNELLMPSASLLMGDLPTMPQAALLRSRRNEGFANQFRQRANFSWEVDAFVGFCAARSWIVPSRFAPPPPAAFAILRRTVLRVLHRTKSVRGTALKQGRFLSVSARVGMRKIPCEPSASSSQQQFLAVFSSVSPSRARLRPAQCIRSLRPSQWSR